MSICRPEGLSRVHKRLSLCTLCAFAVLFLLARPAQADIWTVSGVSVDVTSESAAKAKLLAIGEAQVKAFYRLVDRLVPAKSAAPLKALSADQVGRLLAGLSIEEERTAPKRYIAKLSIRFLANKTRSLFGRYGVRYAEKQSEPILVVPVWVTPQGADIWTGENPWHKAWSELDLNNALIPILLPLGDLTDTNALTAREAIAYNSVKLEALRIRYGASSVLVAGAEPKGETQVRAVMQGTSPVGRIGFDKTYEAEDLASAAALAANRFQLVMQEKWKSENLTTTTSTKEVAPSNSMTIAVPYSSAAEWSVLRSRIQTTRGVGRIDINSLSGRGAVVSIAFGGTVNELRSAFYQSGFDLSVVGGTWVLRPL
ncbi:MAG: DUF2066 domain-containing protein [Alphaproteobacteria bacterium]|nr:DUF2066 domain-containing protein [Alphaproteobacteria bacterium]